MTTEIATRPRIRPVEMGPTEVEVSHEPDGVIRVRAPYPQPPYPRRMTDRFDHWADTDPDRPWLADRGPDGEWRKVSYGEGRRIARSIAQGLIDRGLSAERPLAILSGNDLEHGLLALGALYAGVAYAPVSPAYSLVSTDYSKLRHVLELITPGLVYVADAERFAPALKAVMKPDIGLVAGRNADAWPGAVPYDELAATPATDKVTEATAAVGPETIAKFLFTSGSTGWPKAVIITQKSWCSNQATQLFSYRFTEKMPPVLCDWMPWNHVAGGNVVFGMTIYNGGTLHIDDGSPMPGGVDKTVRNLEEVSPTCYFNVPRGYEALCHHLRRNEKLRRSFFKRVQFLQYAGAGLSQHVWDELDELAVATVGMRIMIITGYGATETGPFAFGPNRPVDGVGRVGIPGAGLEVKLVPADGKLEVRFKGPGIMPGYWRQPDKTAESFDEEGFYMIGDALKFVDEDDPEKGFMFDGRVSEDFKLDTGTWVNTAGVRGGLIAACAPFGKDAVLTGINGPHIGALIFPEFEACRGLAPELAGAGEADIVAHPAVRRAFQEALDKLAAAATGSSRRVARAILLAEPPSIDAHEVTDKGSINAAAVRARRAELVEDLYRDPAPGHVIVAAKGRKP